MLGGELASGAGGHPDHHRHVDLAAGHVEQCGGVVEDLVQGQQAEVDRHDLHDRPHPTDGGPDPGADEGRLRQRRIPDALGSEFLEQAETDAEGSAVGADVLAHQEDPFIPVQRVPDACAQGLAVGGHGPALGE